VAQQLSTESTVLHELVAQFKSQWDMLHGSTDEGRAEMKEVIQFITERQAEWSEIKTMNERIK